MPCLRSPSTSVALTLALLVWPGSAVRAADAGTRNADSQIAKAGRLIKAYPDYIDRLEGNELVWTDGTLMPFDDGDGDKPFKALLDRPDIEDQFALAYPSAFSRQPPPLNFDPGRFRNESFFVKMYGDCTKGEVARRLTTVAWLPRRGGGTLHVTTVNGIHHKLKSVSDELEHLPEKLMRFLVPAAGGYVCRAIAGTSNRSAHAYGAAIDINATVGDYWRWQSQGTYQYRNRIPMEIVHIFEKHGFIWGGKWYHFDTMHFEYRPELLPFGK